MTLNFSLIIMAVVAIPWLISHGARAAAIAAAISFTFGAFGVYLFLPSIAGPFFGYLGIMITLFLAISALVSHYWVGADSAKEKIPVYAGVTALALVLATAVFNSEMFNARQYSLLVPQIEAREWKSDFQPKDPRHFRISSKENALFLAKRAMGQSTTLDANGQPNTIGSQFQVANDEPSIQIIKGELWTIVPLDWMTWGSQWFSSTPGVPGYIKVAGENPIIPAEYVALKNGEFFRFTPETVGNNNLDRWVWSHYPAKIIADKHLEIDDEGKPHYIISLVEPTIGWWGEKVVGALIVDPVTGSGVEKFIPLGEIPHWVDRVEAQSLVHRNIDLHGKYSKGYWNRSVVRSSVLAATETHFGYGSDGEPVFATGITAHITSSSGSVTKSDSLVAVYYTNTRTGKTVEYMLQGGATEERAIEQCNLLGDVKNRGYHGTTPQLYNVYGHISYVIPLQNMSHAFSGVAIVSVMNPQIIAWGPSAHEAELAYKQVIVSNSMTMAIEGTRKLSEITGEVDRIGSMLVSGSTTYFIQVKGMNHLFTVPVSTSAKVPVTRVGDQVWIQYYDSKETVMPCNKFDNKSFTLEASPNEIDVQTRANEAMDKEEKKGDVEAALDKLTPEEKALIKKRLQ